MPIPTEGEWPPARFIPAYSAYRDWDAWYAGDPERLARVYGNRRPPGLIRPATYSGGIVGRAARFLWGSPPASGRDTRIHIPLASDLSATIGHLLFSEPPGIRFDEDSAAAQGRVEELMEDGLTQTLMHAAEAGSALGDVYLRPVLDPEVGPRAFLAVHHADSAIPVFRWGRLVEVTFWSALEESGARVLRLLEHHDVVNGAGRITYALHEGTPDNLGRAVPLTEHPDAAHLVELLDSTGSQPTGLTRLDVVRVPNAGPQRLWRGIPALRYLGRSDHDGNESIYDALDDVWTSWMRDIRLARGRIIVPEYMLTSAGQGSGATWDAEREVYSALRASPDDAAGITLSQFAIRHAEHSATADELVKIALRHAGLSGRTVGDTDYGAAVTATEVSSDERQTYITRGSRVQAWGAGVADAMQLLLELEYAHQLPGAVEPERPGVDFGDAVAEDREMLARVVSLLQAAGAISLETMISTAHPDWDEPQIKAEIKRIQEEKPEPIDVTAGLDALNNGTEDPGGQEEPEADPDGAER